MFSFFRQKFRQLARNGTRPVGRKPTTRHLRCEALEERMLPSLSGSEILVNATKTGVQHQAASATSTIGTSVVVWTEVKSVVDSDVKAQRFDANGNKVGGEITVAGGRSPQHHPIVAMDSKGNFVVVWTHDYSSTDSDLHAARFSASGSRLGSEFTVASSPKHEFDATVAMADNGTFVISYTYQFSSSDRDVKAVLYKATGAVMRTIDVAVSSKSEERSSVSMAGDGRFAVSYQASNNVFVNRYAKDGTKVGTHTVASTSSNEREADVAMDRNGNVIVVWQEYVSSNWNVRGRSISSSGVAGSVFTVSATSAHETLPSVAVDSSTGKFVVAYQTQSSTTRGVSVAEMSASRTVIRKSAVGTGLADPFVSLGGSAHRFLVVSQSVGKRGSDPDGGIFARFGIL